VSEKVTPATSSVHHVITFAELVLLIPFLVSKLLYTTYT